MAKRRRSSLSRRRRQQRRRQTRTLIIVGGVIAAGIAAIAFASNSGIGGGPAAEPERIALDPFLGSEDGAVIITEYGDFACPSCRAWHQAGIREQLLTTYGDDLKFVFKDFPVITAQSPRAAEAGQCALDQGQESFWAFHDTVYETYQGLNDSNLISYATSAGLDTDTFTECLASNLHRATVRADWDEARRLGLPGTPSFTLNGQIIAGVPYFDAFAVGIEGYLGS